MLFDSIVPSLSVFTVGLGGCSSIPYFIVCFKLNSHVGIISLLFCSLSSNIIMGFSPVEDDKVGNDWSVD